MNMSTEGRTMNSLEKINAVADGLNAIGKNKWTVEYPGFIMLQGVPETFAVGNVDGTWGISSTDDEGYDLLNWATGLSEEQETVSRLVYEIQKATDNYLDGKKEENR